MKRKTYIYGDRKSISPYYKEDPDAKVVLGKIWLSDLQKNMLRDLGKCYLTDVQQVIMDKYEEKYKGSDDKSGFPYGWSTFIMPHHVWEYVYGEPNPNVNPVKFEYFTQFYFDNQMESF
ncbi:hypothetical protein ACF0H5_017752 [Mactra antiquata]